MHTKMRRIYVFLFGICLLLLPLPNARCLSDVGADKNADDMSRGSDDSNHTYNLPGWIHPRVPETKTGSNITVTCMLNREFFDRAPVGKCTAADLHFVNVTAGRYVPITSNVRVVNESATALDVWHIEEQNSLLRCMCRNQVIMPFALRAGAAPANIDDLNCWGEDFYQFVCTFTQPWHSLPTMYVLHYSTKDRPNYLFDMPCDRQNLPRVICNSTYGNGLYRQTDFMYYFTLKMSNSLGVLEQVLPFNKIHRMLLTNSYMFEHAVNNKTADSFCISTRMLDFVVSKMTFEYELEVRPKNFPRITSLQHNFGVDKANLSICVFQLPHPGYEYELKLRVRVKDALWSEPYLTRFVTDERPPLRAPRMPAGGYYVFASETQVRIYFEDLQPYEYGGLNLTYFVTELRKNGQPITPLPVTTDSTSAIIYNWENDAKYDIFARSRNRVGVSTESTHLTIYPQTQHNIKEIVPTNVQGIYHSNNGSYSLVWGPPLASASGQQPLSYTIYWCRSKRALQNDCENYIQFEHLNNTQHEYTTSANQKYPLNMAVSANYDGFNTGMLWPICSRDADSDLTRMEPTARSYNESSIIVTWSAEGYCPSILVAYNLTYCELHQQHNLSAHCRTVMIDKNDKSYTITGLKPYTYYTIRMLMFSNTKMSKYSNDIEIRTREAAPTPPMNLRLVYSTNTSAQISWDPPTTANGQVRQYILRVENINEHTQKHISIPTNISAASLDQQHQQTKPIIFHLTNLACYTEYEVSVAAETIYASNYSDPVHFKTDIGVPTAPLLFIENVGDITMLRWDKPVRPAGRLEFYEVLVIKKGENNTIVQEQKTLIRADQSKNACNVTNMKCDPNYSYEYQVRAVNVEFSHEGQHKAYPTTSHYTGERDLRCHYGLPLFETELLTRLNNDEILNFKSPYATHIIRCSQTEAQYLSVLSTLYTLLSFVLAVLSLAGVYYLYMSYNHMTNIHVTLPTGLESFYTKPTGADAFAGRIVDSGDSDGQQSSFESPHKSGNNFSWPNARDINNHQNTRFEQLAAAPEQNITENERLLHPQFACSITKAEPEADQPKAAAQPLDTTGTYVLNGAGNSFLTNSIMLKANDSDYNASALLQQTKAAQEKPHAFGEAQAINADISVNAGCDTIISSYIKPAQMKRFTPAAEHLQNKFNHAYAEDIPVNEAQKALSSESGAMPPRPAPISGYVSINDARIRSNIASLVGQLGACDYVQASELQKLTGDRPKGTPNDNVVPFTTSHYRSVESVIDCKEAGGGDDDRKILAKCLSQEMYSTPQLFL